MRARSVFSSSARAAAPASITRTTANIPAMERRIAPFYTLLHALPTSSELRLERALADHHLALAGPEHLQARLQRIARHRPGQVARRIRDLDQDHQPRCPRALLDDRQPAPI